MRRVSVSLVLVVALVATIGGTVFGSMYGSHAGFPIAKLKLNGQEVTPPSPAIVVDSTTYVPQRFVATTMGAGIGWDEATETVSINFQQQPPQPQPPFKKGTLVPAGDYKVVANSTRVSNGTKYNQPGAGNVFFVVDISLQNVGKESVDISPISFKIGESQGYTYKNAYVSEVAQTELRGTILPGRILRGEIVFEVPAQSVGLELLFDYDYSGGQVVISLE